MAGKICDHALLMLGADRKFQVLSPIRGECLDDSAVVVTEEGQIIYHPGMKGCFESAETALSELVNKGDASFQCKGIKYQVKDSKLKTPNQSRDEKKKVFSAARTNALKMKDELDRHDLLIKIIEAMFLSGFEEEAKSLASEARELVKGLKDIKKGNEAFVKIANSYIKMGSKEELDATLHLALDSVESGVNAFYVRVGIDEVCHVLDKSDLGPDQRKGIIDKALKIARNRDRFKDKPMEQASALIHIAPSMKKAGYEKRDIIKVMSEAEAVIKQEHSHNMKKRCSAMSYLAYELSRLGYKEESLAMFNEITDGIIPKVRTEEVRDVLIEMAPVYILKSQLDAKDVIALYDKLIASSRRIPEKWHRHNSMTSFSMNLAQYGVLPVLDANKIFDAFIKEVEEIKYKDDRGRERGSGEVKRYKRMYPRALRNRQNFKEDDEW